MTKHIHGGDVYTYKDCNDFSANCNPLGTPESVKEAIRNSLNHISNYPQVGCTRLISAIADYEKVDENYIICGNGAADLIFNLCRAKKPQKALLLAPSFAEYEQALMSVDCQISRFYLREEDDFYVGEKYIQALEDKPDMIFLCNPNNPTGILTDRQFLLEILEKCRQLGTFVAVDECFLDFVKSPGQYTLKEKLREYDNLFILKAFTKRYAMAGVRLGYGMCSDKGLLEKMEQMTQPWNVSTMAQEAGIAALKENSYVEKGRKIIFEEAEWLKNQMTRLGLKIFPSQANYIFFKGPGDLFDSCIRKGILIRDCSNYPGLTRGFFRVAVKQHEDNRKLILALKDILL